MKNNKSRGGNKKKVERAKGGGIIPGNLDSPKIALQNGGAIDEQKGEAREGTHVEVTQQEDQNKPSDGHQTADENFEGDKMISASPSSVCAPVQVPPSGKKVECPKKESNRKKAQKGRAVVKKGAASHAVSVAAAPASAAGDMNMEKEKQSGNNKKRNKPSSGKNSKKGEQKVTPGEDSKKGVEEKTKGEIAYEGTTPINEQPVIGSDLEQSNAEREAAIISPDHQMLESEAGKNCEDPHVDLGNASGVKINANKKRKISKRGEADGQSGTGIQNEMSKQNQTSEQNETNEQNQTNEQRERKDGQGATSQPDTTSDERRAPPETTTLVEKNQKKTASKSEAANKPKGAKITLSEEETKEKIYKYMKQTNRPYSVINVYDNLHGTISKNVVQKLMDELSAEKKLQCKEYGKAKVYLVNQREFKSLNVQEMGKLKKDMEMMREQMEVAKNDLTHFVKIKKKIIQDLELVENVGKYKKECQLVEEEIKMCEEANKACKLTADEIGLIKKQHGYLHAMWLKRKSLCVEIIKCVATLTDKDSKGVIFHLGIDVDEDVVPPGLYA
ncbi:Tat binding protein 1(TBP-1)-interacting protein, putative [Plasmodium vivax]|uniref:Tat binding protein 1(TBP-1)-interacting protein, putative n=1 Tax=Plasmodium vivax TaxID=5855 RepID=A0A1G4H2U7_PLAVI|nr:Tat binding protein 1(TBP-1)-interacting protein, putative [Plasmodium vivax]SCO74641.1 Tat binding protein 1(TBP-1)-interacting protein, putative [Plasmodium vivax]